MAEHLRPVGRHVKFAGWARTIACMDMYHVDDDPYGTEIEAIDSILPGEVVVVSTGGSRRNAPWGELLSTAAIARGARGAVVDGLVRDVRAHPGARVPAVRGRHQAGGLARAAGASWPTTCRCSAAACSCRRATWCSPISTASSRFRRRWSRRSSGSRPTRCRARTHSRDELQKGAYLRTVYDKYGGVLLRTWPHDRRRAHARVGAAGAHRARRSSMTRRSTAGNPDLEIAVDLDAHWAAMAPVDRAIVLGFRARHVGVLVPNEYVAAYVDRHPGEADRLLLGGPAGCGRRGAARACGRDARAARPEGRRRSTRTSTRRTRGSCALMKTADALRRARADPPGHDVLRERVAGAGQPGPAAAARAAVSRGCGW